MIAAAPATTSTVPVVLSVPAPTSIPSNAPITMRPNAIVNVRPAMMYAVMRRRGPSAASSA